MSTRTVWLLAISAAFLSHHAWPAGNAKAAKPKAAPSHAPAASSLKFARPDFSKPVPKPNIKSKVTPGRPQSKVKISPSSTAPRPTTSFELVQAGADKLTLRYRSSDPNLELNPRGRLAIQLFADEGIELSPEVVTAGEWKKGQNELTITIKATDKALAGKQTQVNGEAVYNVCHHGTKSCRNEGSRFSALVKP